MRLYSKLIHQVVSVFHRPTLTVWGTPDGKLRGWAGPSKAWPVQGARTGRWMGGTLLGGLATVQMFYTVVRNKSIYSLTAEMCGCVL